MRRVVSSYPAGGNHSWSGWDDEDDELTERRPPPDWRLVAIIGVYGAVLFSVGLLLAA